MKLVRPLPAARASTVAGCLLVMLASHNARAVMLEGFETPTLPADQRLTYSPTGAQWVFGGTTGRGIQRNGSDWRAQNAPQGRQTAFLQGGNAKISSTVRLAAGGHYKVSFYAARRPLQPNVPNPIRVSVGGVPRGEAIAPSSTEFQQYATPAFYLEKGGDVTIELASTNAAVGDFVTFVDAVSITQVGQQESMVIDIMPTDAEGVIRDDIGHATFGSGVEFQQAQMRMTMEPQLGYSPALGNTIGALRLGSFRFPNGTPGLHYFSEYPYKSYPEDAAKGTNPTTAYRTPEEIVRYTGPERWNMERVFEVNTDAFLDYGAMRYVKKTDAANRPILDGAGQPIIDAQKLGIAASRAADWVRRDQQQTLYWEVGNEDWARWSAAQYADIFLAFEDEMKRARPDIRLLAQGTVSTFNGNTPEAWLGTLKDRLQSVNKIGSVHAYSIHQYLSTDPYLADTDPSVRRSKQTRDLFGKIAEGEPVKTIRRLLGKDTANASTRDWQIWMTEYNIQQPTGRADGSIAKLQDMGHALVIADWTGNLLEQKIDRLFMLSLDDNPSFAMVQYTHDGTTLANPRVTVPGYAFGIYSQEFGKTMLRNTVANNPVITAPNGKRYPQVGVYSSIDEAGAAMKVVVINRDLSNAATVRLNVLPAGRKLVNGQYALRRLSAANITDGNMQSDAVKWQGPMYGNQSTVDGIAQRLEPGSVNLFTLPLKAAQ
ncbi:hypothetical protein AAW51_3365 [Caldimonas brevitalea]|uniref:Alpha-L-arabinofuranosidase n=2 Tax=Caldimonas brevitalea TaxID=413882 RepID=A0A0G3BRQ2_9BURK|nr:hypothetical protein AAW51_3365 [Caldimonas brevitalea]